MDGITYLEYLKERYEELYRMVSLLFYFQDWLAIAVVAIVTTTLFLLFNFIIKKVTHKISQKKKHKWLVPIIERSIPPLKYLIIVLGLFVIGHIIDYSELPDKASDTAHSFFNIILIIQLTWLCNSIINVVIERSLKSIINRGDKTFYTFFPNIKALSRVIIWTISIIIIVQEMGYSISAIVTGLGIGGIAVAMAAKDTLSNFIGSFIILSDNIFRIGDWVIIDNHEGMIEEIGFRTTRIRTFKKALIAIPNSIVANTPINNLSRMPIRRIKMIVGLTYDTKATTMASITQKIRTYLHNSEEIDQTTILVYFKDFGESSLNIFLYFFSKSTDWEEYLHLKELVNLEIMKIVEEEGAQFAFPTQTLYIQNEEKNRA